MHGKVHGKTIKLNEDLGLPDGQDVEITVRAILPSATRQPGEGFLRTEGALAEDPYWDAIMEEIHEERKKDTRREISE
jgi:hypothetical protein